ncbi:phytanoyl-CoA dioxygenase family protein [Sulfitobacter sp.]|uniref:phytanoyl-CoA dioxygenase family protein n=1 Tax=Sulfitobacter sp. TaxID=1903071 RepID=UPI003001C84B
MTWLKSKFETEGRVWIRNALSEETLGELDEIASLQSKAGQRVNPSVALSQVFTTEGSLMRAIAMLDQRAHPVRTVAFNKSEGTNWGVPWHQDRFIAGAHRCEIDGYENWTNKSSTWHCEPLQSVLDEMLFVRVHLDATDRENGAMEIAKGSHRHGIVPAADAATIAHQHEIESCDADRGDILILKMLTLHGSKPSKIKTDRRVLRIDFASTDLPAPLKWTS